MPLFIIKFLSSENVEQTQIKIRNNRYIFQKKNFDIPFPSPFYPFTRSK